MASLNGECLLKAKCLMKTFATLFLGFASMLITASAADPKGPAKGALNLPITGKKAGIVQQTARTLYYPLNVKKGSTIKITIAGAGDDTGDNALEWSLVDASKAKLIFKAKAVGDKPLSWTVRNIAHSYPILIFQDKDTQFSGKRAGNLFSFSVAFSK
jgi:hypothetical protein